MEQFFAVLEKFLSGSPRTGWILLILGTAMILLGRFEVLPANDMIPGWQAFFWLCAVLGIAILFVSLGAWCLGRLVFLYGKIKEKRDRRAVSKHLLTNGLDYLGMLPNAELSALIWILNYKGERFIDADFRYSNAKGLITRGIVFQDTSSPANDVYFVNPLVWDKKMELLADHDDLIQYYKPW